MHTTTIKKRHPTEILIEQARKLLKPAPVRLHHVPNWLRLRILKAFGCRNGWTNGEDVLQRAVRQTSTSLWLDHWGSAELKGKRVFISEPYNVTKQTIADIGAFCEPMGLEFYISANSWWLSGWTVRIVTYEPEGG